jgi:hypothetical protein
MFGRRKLEKKVQNLEGLLEKQVTFLHANSYMKQIGFDFKNNEGITDAIKQVPELAAPLNYIGSSFISGKFQHKRNDIIVDSSEYLDIFRQPNPLMGKSEFFRNCIEILKAYGWFFIYVNTPTVPSSAKSMTILDPTKTKIKTKVKNHSDSFQLDDISDIIKKIKYEDGLETTSITYDESKFILVAENTKFTIEDYELKFESPTAPLNDAFEVTPALYSSLSNINNNGGMIGIISGSGSDEIGRMFLEESEQKSIDKQLKRYGTKKGQKLYAYSKIPIDYTQLNSKIKDLDATAQRKLIKEVIADVLGFDNILLNNTDGNKYANYVQARKSFFSELIMPSSKIISEALSNYFFAERPNEIFHFDYSHHDVFTKSDSDKAKQIETTSKFIISLNAAVFKKEMTKDNAINVLVSEGYEKETAKTLIQ